MKATAGRASGESRVPTRARRPRAAASSARAPRWAPVEDVVHHDDVDGAGLAGPQRDVADPVGEVHAQERQPVVGRRREERACETPEVLRKLSDAFVDVSTSESTAPNPSVAAGVPPLVPGTKKLTSVSVLPAGENRRGALNVVKFPYVAVLNVVARPEGGAWMCPAPAW